MRFLIVLLLMSTQLCCSQLPPSTGAAHVITADQWSRAEKKNLRIPAREFTVSDSLIKSSGGPLQLALKSDECSDVVLITLSPSKDQVGITEVVISYSDNGAEYSHVYWPALKTHSLLDFNFQIEEHLLKITIQDQTKAFTTYKNPILLQVRN